MKTFKELPNLSFFRIGDGHSFHVRQKVRYDADLDINNFNITVGLTSYIEEGIEIVEMEPCEGGFREKKLKFTDLKPG